jgi:hypothetical protein
MLLRFLRLHYTVKPRYIATLTQRSWKSVKINSLLFSIFIYCYPRKLPQIAVNKLWCYIRVWFYFYCRYFTSSWNKISILHLKWILLFMTVLSSSINHEIWNPTASTFWLSLCKKNLLAQMNNLSLTCPQQLQWKLVSFSCCLSCCLSSAENSKFSPHTLQ